MRKLDRLGWTAGFSFEAYGVRVGVRSNTAEVLPELQKRLPYGWRLSSSSLVEAIYSLKVGGPGARPGLKQFHLVYGNFVRMARTINFDEALDIFETDIQLYVAESARRKVFVHAGVVGWQGQAILIPGQSLSGKSSLVRALIKAGATYYSDEYALLDTKGRVHSHPSPLGVRTHLSKKQEKYPVEHFGGTVGTKPLPIGLIVLTKFKENARWHPKVITASEGLLALLSNTISARRKPINALSTLQQVVLNAPVLKGVRGETDEVVEALLNRPWPTL